MALMTLAEAKAHLNITGTAHDAELPVFMEAATAPIEQHVGPVVVRTVTTTGQHGTTILEAPVASLTSVTNGGVTVPATGYVLDADSGLIVGRLNGATITYTAGRSPVPEAIRLAALIVLARLWETQRGNAPSALPSSDAPDGGFSTGGLPLLPPLAVALLEPYRRGQRT